VGQIPKNRIGRVQRRIRRAFIASEGRPLLTIDLLEHAYPRVDRYQRWHYKTIYKSAEKAAERVGGPGRAFIVWGPNRELAERLAEDASADKH
jgi:hypothetical protein